MTFSLSPRRSSILPFTDASVSTRVVSWNEAAEMKLSVESEALRDPEQQGLPRRRFSAVGLDCLVDPEDAGPVDLLARHEPGIPGLDDLRLAQHLADDDLDVLVVDLDALGGDRPPAPR